MISWNELLLLGKHFMISRKKQVFCYIINWINDIKNWIFDIMNWILDIIKWIYDMIKEIYDIIKYFVIWQIINDIMKYWINIKTACHNIQRESSTVTERKFTLGNLQVFKGAQYTLTSIGLVRILFLEFYIFSYLKVFYNI